MQELLRKVILSILYPLTILLGYMKVPFLKRRTTEADASTVLRIARHGDIVLSHNRGELSNLLILDFWKHVAVVIELGGVKFVIEAINPLVRVVPLDWWVLHHDYVQILHPNFLTPQQTEAWPLLTLPLIGREYDYMFEPGNKAFYCAEIITWAIMKVYGDDCPWTHRKTLGVDTTLPQDFANSSKFVPVSKIFGR